MGIQLDPDTEKSIKLAASKLRFKTKDSKSGITAELYRYGRPYGFETQLLNNEFMVIPGLDVHTVDCFTNAVEKYLIAKELGLNPRFFSVYGFDRKEKPPQDGLSELEKRVQEIQGEDEGTDHSIIDIERPKDRKRIIIDNQMGNFGLVKYEQGKIKVRKGRVGPAKAIGYSQMFEYDEDDLQKKIEFLQSPEGKVRMLESGQKIGIEMLNCKHGGFFFVDYDRNEDSIETQLQLPLPVIMNFAVTSTAHLDEGAGIKRRDMRFCQYMESTWNRLKGQVSFGRYEKDEVEAYWKVLRKAFSRDFRNPSSHLKKHAFYEHDKELDRMGIPHMLSSRSIDDALQRMRSGEELGGLSPDDIEPMRRVADSVENQYQTAINDQRHSFMLCYMCLGKLIYDAALKESGQGTVHEEKEIYGLLEKLRRKAAVHATKNKLAWSRVDDKASGIETMGDKSIASLVKDAKEVEEKLLEARREYREYRDLMFISPGMYKTSVDMDLVLKDAKEYLERESGKLLKSTEAFVKKHSDELHDFFCRRVRWFMIMAYQAKTHLDLKPYMPNILKTIKDYKDATTQQA